MKQEHIIKINPTCEIFFSNSPNISTMEYGLAEFIDNSISAALNKEVNVRINYHAVWNSEPRKRSIDKINSYIEIIDNASGISVDKLNLALSPYNNQHIDNPGDGHNLYSIGLKSAIFALGGEVSKIDDSLSGFEIITKTKNEDAILINKLKYGDLSVEINSNLNNLFLDGHGTIIKIYKLKKIVRDRIQDIKQYTFSDLEKRYFYNLRGVDERSKKCTKLNLSFHINDAQSEKNSKNFSDIIYNFGQTDHEIEWEEPPQTWTINKEGTTAHIIYGFVKESNKTPKTSYNHYNKNFIEFHYNSRWICNEDPRWCNSKWAATDSFYRLFRGAQNDEKEKQYYPKLMVFCDKSLIPNPTKTDIVNKDLLKDDILNLYKKMEKKEYTEPYNELEIQEKIARKYNEDKEEDPNIDFFHSCSLGETGLKMDFLKIENGVRIPEEVKIEASAPGVVQLMDYILIDKIQNDDSFAKEFKNLMEKFSLKGRLYYIYITNEGENTLKFLKEKAGINIIKKYLPNQFDIDGIRKKRNNKK